MNRTSTDILIVGGGPAGMSAAFTASADPTVNVAVIDENPLLGGQIWRAELGKLKSKDARETMASLDRPNVSILSNASVFAADGKSIIAETPNGRLQLEYKKIIISTGARERFLPFPGWTLPNVFGAAGLQALVKGGLSVENKRIVVAGTGPLLLVVADYLASKGATIVAICEQASNKKLDRFALGLWRTPSKIAQGIALRRRLRGIPYYRNAWVASAHGESKLQGVKIQRFLGTMDLECDMLACGFHLVPNIELAQVLGCLILDGFVAVDDYQETSLRGVYCAGEPTGIEGVDASLVEGKIAGFAAVSEWDRARSLFGERRRTKAFADTLDRTFGLREELKSLAHGSTMVCRCEDVQYGKLVEYHDFRTAKLQTRCGMGSCQGRICGSAVEFLFGWNDRSVRPPILPIKMENL